MKIALVGNQNSGKTTLFNTLTGTNQKVGNWPGVTIERKEGKIIGTDIAIVDLPGVYSLSPYSTEEEISRQFAMEEKPDLIINIIDATSIERSLYLTTQLLELDTDVVIALNMADIVETKGISIDVDKLSALLHTSIVSISAKKNIGVDKLVELISKANYLKNEHERIYDERIEKLIVEISKKTEVDHKRFAAVKIIERDRDYRTLLDNEISSAIAELEDYFKMDSEQLIADQRYKYIVKIKEDCTKYTKKGESITDKLDRIFLHKYFALPIFAIIMAVVYFLSVGLVGGLTVEFVASLFDGAETIEIFGNEVQFNIIGLGPLISQLLEGAGASPWAVSLVVDGIIAGFGAVCGFLPQLIILFFCLAILETTGYMSRISFFLDRLFKKFGLSGKSLIPFIVGSGCSVPGIMASRTVECEEERRMTALLTPFVPCSAKLPIIALFASYFFATYAWLVTLGLYLMAIVVILLSALVLKKFVYKKATSSYLSELPEYHAPSALYFFRDVFDKTWAFIKRAGTVIVLSSIVVWLLASFTWTFNYIDGVNFHIEQSILAGLGNALAWVFYPMLGGTWSWGASVSAIQGLIAKEQVVSSLEVLAGLEGNGAAIFDSGMFAFFNGWSAFAYMVFNLFSAPCFAAIGAMRRELGSTKAMVKAVFFQTGLAWILATLIGVIGWIVV
ncbi:MAG: ferrous iron transport protein B [Bacteroidia bacterium]|nr:ferrous iron transport protein B [Bacteroidia bacterium]